MDHKIMDDLINSISRFNHLVACHGTKKTPVLKDFRNLVGILKPFRSVLDKLLNSPMPLDEQFSESMEDLDVLVTEATEMLEKLPQKSSTLFNVLRCGPLLMKIQMVSKEACSCLRNMLQISPFMSLSISVQHLIQELGCADQDQMSELIEFTLKDQRENAVPGQQFMTKVIDSLGLTSNKELLRESIALEKDREKAEQMRNKEDIDHIYEIIDLVKHIRGLMEKSDQFGVINGLPIPLYFRCPLSLGIMLDPVILASGQTYERCFIQKWLDHGLIICPKTRQNLFHTNLVPNYTVKALIDNWCEENDIKMNILNGDNHTHYMLSTTVMSEFTDHTSSSHGSGNRDSFKGAFHDVVNEIEVESVEFSSQNGKEDAGADHHLPLRQAVDLRSETSVEQEPYSHSRSDSVSSVNSTTELLRTFENRKNLSGCSLPSSKGFSSWLSSSQTPSLEHGSDTGFGNISCPRKSNFDLPASDFHIKKLVNDLKSQSNESQTTAALELRLLARYNMDNRVLMAQCGAISPLISLLYSKVKTTQENAVTALLNLSIHDDNKSAIAEAGAMEPLIHVLKCGNMEARENAAATLSSLSMIEEYRIKIGSYGAARGLVNLLFSGTLRGKKDAAAALFSLSIFHENKARIVQAGAVKYLVELLDPEKGMTDKAVALLANLSTIPEGRISITQAGGIPLLVEIVEYGSERGKENAATVLLQLSLNCPKFCSLVLQEGAIPPLIALSQQGTPRAKEKNLDLFSAMGVSYKLDVYVTAGTANTLPFSEFAGQGCREGEIMIRVLFR